MSKENFKEFARLHPSLATAVMNNKASWQKLYELYDIYGENSSIWNSYIENDSVISNLSSSTKPLKDATFSDFIDTIKNVDLDTVQRGINNIQKTIGLLQDMGIGGTSAVKAPYEARPMYKYFED